MLLLLLAIPGAAVHIHLLPHQRETRPGMGTTGGQVQACVWMGVELGFLKKGGEPTGRTTADGDKNARTPYTN